MIKLKYAFITLALFMASCSKDKIEDLPPEKTEETKENNNETIVNNYVISKTDVGLKNKNIQPTSFYLLGYGYDAKENTIHVINDLRQKVVNMESLSIERYDIFNTRRNEYHFASGLTKEKALSMLRLTNTKTTNSTYNNFDFQKNLPENNISITRQIAKVKTLRLYKSGLKAVNYTADFNTAILNLTPKEIVEKFGTHIISDFYQGFFYTFINFIDTENKTNNTITRNWKGLIYAAGSDISKIVINDDVLDLGEFLKNYAEENSQFVGFSDLNEQIPLYELVAKGEKREALKQYIEEYLK